MQACTFTLAALLCSAAQAAAAFSFNPYQTYAVGSWADAVAVGDVDGDGRNDVVMTTTLANDPNPENDYKLFVFFQREDGTLAVPVKLSYRVTSSNTYTALALVDLDRNGSQDIIVGHEGGLTVIPGNGARQLAARKIPGPETFTAVTMDVDLDGHTDVVGQSWYQGVTIYHGDRAGKFSRRTHLPTNASGYSYLDVGDLNSDGFKDLAIVSAQGLPYLDIYLHDQVDGFNTTPIVIQPNFGPSIGGVAIGDFNSDGRNDVAINSKADAPTTVAVYFQNENGELGLPTDFASGDQPSAMIGGDIDGNGLDDLLVMHSAGFGIPLAVGLYAQNNIGLQPEVQTPSVTSETPTGMAVGDINSDGCKDVVIASRNEGLAWLHGTGCEMPPEPSDMGVAVGLTPTTAAIRLEHLSGTEPLQQPLVQIDLKAVRTGTLQTGPLPAGCVLQSQTANARRIECLVDTLVPGAVTTVIIPITAASSSLNLLTVSAQARTDTPERSTLNNRASLTIKLAPPAPSSRWIPHVLSPLFGSKE